MANWTSQTWRRKRLVLRRTHPWQQRCCASTNAYTLWAQLSNWIEEGTVLSNQRVGHEQTVDLSDDSGFYFGPGSERWFGYHVARTPQDAPIVFYLLDGNPWDPEEYAEGMTTRIRAKLRI